MKNISTDRRDRMRFYQKNDWIFYMRVSYIYMIAMLGSASVFGARPTIGQGLEQEVVIGMEHESAIALIEKIEAATDFNFVFKKEVVGLYTDITFPDKLRTIHETLTLGLSNTGLEFYLSGRNIVLKDGVNDASTDNGELVKRIAVYDRMDPVIGVVRDKQGAALPGVNVVVKGTTIGTSTDANGRFIIDVPVGSEVLVFSFIGLKTVELALGDRTSFDVEMQADVTTLNEVVVNGGYYTTTDRMKIGTIVKVTSKEIENQPLTNPLMALQGRVPGLDITPTSGAPGSALNIQIRGRNSLRNNTNSEVANSPLYVVDGVPIDPSPLRSGSSTFATVVNGYDPLSTINPANIASIEILKDADATAIYGSRGANGVILITTKTSSKGEHTGVDINVYSGIGQMAHKMDLLNTEQYVMMRKEAFANDKAVPSVIDYDVNGTWDTTRYTDWQEELLGGTAIIQDVQAGLSGSTARTSFRFNAGYHKESAIYHGDFGFKLLSGSLSVDHMSLNNKFRASFRINYGVKRSSVFESTTFMNQVLQLAPNAPALYNDDGTLNWEIVKLGTTERNSFTNPLAKLRNVNEVDEHNLISNMNFDYELFPGFFVKVNLGLTDMNADEFITSPISSQPPTNIVTSTTGSAMFGNNRRSSIIAEPQLLYSKGWNSHKLDFVIGGTWQESRSEYQSISGGGYTSDFLLNSLLAATSMVTVADVDNHFKYFSTFFRGSYNFKEKYLLTLTGRRDGSSRFGPGKRFGNFGSLGVAWIFSNEKFMNSWSFLTLGKLRASLGITGSDQIGDYRYMDTYKISGYRYQGGIGMLPIALYNSDFSWEETQKTEAAIELGFFQNRVFFEVDLYRNRSGSQLIDYSLPSISGFDAVFRNFPATVENTGVEASLQVRSLQSKNISIVTGFNISLNRNELVDFPGLEKSPYGRQYKVGEPLSVRRLFISKGVNAESGLFEVVDVDANGTFDTGDRQFMKPTDRRYYGGLVNTVTFKSLELSFTIQFSKQDKNAYMVALPAGTRNLNMPVSVLNRWQSEGDVTDVQKFSQASAALIALTRYSASTGRDADASFIRLKTLSLSYRLPDRWLERISLRNARVFLQGQNLLTFTSYAGLDPETEVALPPLRMVSAGLSVGF